MREFGDSRKAPGDDTSPPPRPANGATACPPPARERFGASARRSPPWPADRGWDRPGRCCLVGDTGEPRNSPPSPSVRRRRAPGRPWWLRASRSMWPAKGTGGPTVVIVNGLGADSSEWNDEMPSLAEKSRVCVVDRAGTGDSPNGRRTPTVRSRTPMSCWPVWRLQGSAVHTCSSAGPTEAWFRWSPPRIRSRARRAINSRAWCWSIPRYLRNTAPSTPTAGSRVGYH